MTNKEIANQFNALAKIMELHGENPYRFKSYANVYIQLRKLQTPLTEMPEKEIAAVKGVGKGALSKIQEIISTGQLAALEEYKAKTPPGILEMLNIKGFGPKKIMSLWKELEIETVGELLYACNENRLVELKGFGAKTQEDLRKKLAYHLQSRGKSHYAAIEPKAQEYLNWLTKKLKPKAIDFVGEMGRYCPIINQVEVLVATDKNIDDLFDDKTNILSEKTGEGSYKSEFKETSVTLHVCEMESFGSKKFRYTSSPEFIKGFLAKAKSKDFTGMANEKEVFAKAKIPFIAPELRETAAIVDLALKNKLPEKLIEASDIKGVIHSHTTYSDGIHSLEEMVTYAQEKGFSYIAITDHSKAAFYANGLHEDRLKTQWEEIDQLNAKMTDFKIFKSIESDILNDGSLDYDERILKQFDFIIASVHSNLKMDKEKATTRLLKAIENPYTKILGHPTGRLLLSREGYPIDHAKIIDACAANGVSIELNANPYRLDIDYTWIPYAKEKGVLISINPDAHSREGIHDIRFGVYAARKGQLTAETCLNSRSLADFEAYMSS